MTELHDSIKKLAGRTYRVERSEDGFRQVPLRGRRGHIYEHGPGVLAAYITSERPQFTFAVLQRQLPLAHAPVRAAADVILQDER